MNKFTAIALLLGMLLGGGAVTLTTWNNTSNRGARLNRGNFVYFECDPTMTAPVISKVGNLSVPGENSTYVFRNPIDMKEVRDDVLNAALNGVQRIQNKRTIQPRSDAESGTD